ncbi:MAG: bifunctional riboflavin kinase/FAD synthetase [SAR202 cluster bacterium]|nr:bifunctional riboflavin kinase/FAD synthetase [SAR202 cluster bacterium]
MIDQEPGHLKFITFNPDTGLWEEIGTLVIENGVVSPVSHLSLYAIVAPKDVLERNGYYSEPSDKKSAALFLKTLYDKAVSLSTGDVTGIEVRLDTRGTTVGYIESVVNYPADNFNFLGLDTKGTVCDKGVHVVSQAPGRIVVRCEATSLINFNDSLLVATLRFEAKQEGTTNLDIDPVSEVRPPGSNENILGYLPKMEITVDLDVPPIQYIAPVSPKNRSIIPGIPVEELVEELGRLWLIGFAVAGGLLLLVFLRRRRRYIIPRPLLVPPPDRDTVVTIGMFDGVHLGHQHLIAAVIQEAKDKNRRSAVVTFKNHPATVLRPSAAPLMIITLEERISRLKALGVDYIVPIEFDKALASLTAEDFLKILQEDLRMKGFVVGPDFAMGRGRKGDVKALHKLSEDMHFDLRIVGPLKDPYGEAVRSTNIRKQLAAGYVSRVSNQMGRHFVLRGPVVHGNGKGSGLGFPTANLNVPPGMAIPADGVYAGHALVDGQRYMSAISIGSRPTFENGTYAIEAFILDFSGDIYGKDIGLEFVHRLRGQVKFATVEDLQKQVDKDIAEARAILLNAGTR